MGPITFAQFLGTKKDRVAEVSQSNGPPFFLQNDEELLTVKKSKSDISRKGEGQVKNCHFPTASYLSLLSSLISELVHRLLA